MLNTPKFTQLLGPCYIGPVEIKNRLVKTASGTCLLREDGFVADNYKAYYETLAKGGVGLINIEDCTVEYPRGAHNPPYQLRLDDDKYISSYAELTRLIHQCNCSTFLQLMHAGAWNLIHDNPKQCVSASTLTERELPGPHFDAPRELSVSEIGDLVNKFADAAVRARQAGFDGVEVNGSTCHLINSFLSGFWNRRQDTYGCQSLESRARFAEEIVREIKKRAGSDFPVIFLLNGAEFGVEKGITIDESRVFAKIFESAKADAIHVRAQGYGDYFAMLRPEQLFNPEPPKNKAKELDWRHKGAGATVPLAAAIKKAVSIPVITVGRIDPFLGEKILREGKADFIGMARRLLADPELPHKISAGSLEDIAPCTACLSCTSEVAHNRPVRCRINAALGGEKKYYDIKKTIHKKKVVIVGGGPGGMEAARVAALRGHEVILYEKEPKLGGLLPLAALVKGVEIEDLPALIRYLKRQITKLGVNIRLGQEFTPETAQKLKPDVVILATGGLQTIPGIPGVDGHNVITSDQLHHQVKPYLRIFGPQIIRWLTRFWLPVGKRVVIIGGQLQGCEVAELLVKRGRIVTIVDESETLGTGLSVDKNIRLFDWFQKKGVRTFAGVKYEEILESGISVITREGQRQVLQADNIITAPVPQPNTILFNSLKGKVPELYTVGDCKSPGLIINAIYDGYHTSYGI